jgi:hypothetical protein
VKSALRGRVVENKRVLVVEMAVLVRSFRGMSRRRLSQKPARRIDYILESNDIVSIMKSNSEIGRQNDVDCLWAHSLA